MGRGARSTASVKDVARAAGVSVGTVSNVLNRPDMVAEATRDRVRAAIGALGFVRNEAARHLRSGSSRAIGLVVIDNSNPFFTTMARGAEDTVAEHGDVVLVANSAADTARERRHLELFEQQRVRGILLTPTHDIPDLGGFERLGIPVVYLDHYLPECECSSVSVDDVAGGRLAGEHLVGLGHRRVCFAGGPTSLHQVRHRLAGFREVVEAAGGQVSHADTAGLTVGSGRRIGATFDPHDPERPTGLFAANDLVAIGVLNELVSRGLRVPRDLSIVGFDDIDFAATTTVPLTSIHQPAYDLGRKGAQMLYELLGEAPAGGATEWSDRPDGATREPSGTRAGDPMTSRDRQVRFTPTLVVRESSGAPSH
ncbi:MAG: LacI family DNA-binding transcriptional regulator [Micrococcales bacterium]|nr:LacI family DNA-binding transcriptional regulator [Micrococcales bacterium]